MSRCKYGKLKSPTAGRRCKRAPRKTSKRTRRSRRRLHAKYGASGLLLAAGAVGIVYLVVQNVSSTPVPPS